MKNRDWFLKTATIDRLYKMNKQLLGLNKGVCVMHCFMSDYQAFVRCGEQSECSLCIQSWLNEERKNTK